jgi:ammonia channel protein AmtB
MFFDAPSVPAILGSIICFLSLAILAVVLRFQARNKLRQRIQIDDWLALFGLVGVIGLTSMLFAGIRTTSLGYPWIESEDPAYLKLIMAIKVRFHEVADVSLLLNPKMNCVH